MARRRICGFNSSHNCGTWICLLCLRRMLDKLYPFSLRTLSFNYVLSAWWMIIQYNRLLWREIRISMWVHIFLCYDVVGSTHWRWMIRHMMRRHIRSSLNIMRMHHSMARGTDRGLGWMHYSSINRRLRYYISLWLRRCRSRSTFVLATRNTIEECNWSWIVIHLLVLGLKLSVDDRSLVCEYPLNISHVMRASTTSIIHNGP